MGVAAAGQDACREGATATMRWTGPTVASALLPLAQRSLTKSYPRCEALLTQAQAFHPLLRSP